MSRVASRAFSTDHWLPTRARAWLERVESAAFTRALVDAMKTVPSLAGREDTTASRIASRAEELYAEESSTRRELGDVESTHVKTAARALATYETLRPFLGNDEATLEFVRARRERKDGDDDERWTRARSVDAQIPRESRARVGWYGGERDE